MRYRFWIVLLVLGLAVSAKPAGRRVKRLWNQWSAVAMWDACRMQPPAGQHGEPYAWLNIPSTGINQLVLDGVNKDRLGRFPCREQMGKATLVMAHRDTHFQGLKTIAEGDVIDLELRNGKCRKFRTKEIHIVDKVDIETFIHTKQDSDCLLLLTCYPFRHIGPAPQRFVVVAYRSL